MKIGDLTREEVRYQIARLIDGEPFMNGPRRRSLRVAEQILDYLGWVSLQDAIDAQQSAIQAIATHGTYEVK